MDKWTAYGLPDDMTGLTFLDVGCWEGNNCVEAVKRNAAHVVGIDICTSESLRHNVQAHNFEFLQLDVLSEKFLELGFFDVVLCSGVLYHVENVLSLLFRLRKTVTRLLVLETAVHTMNEDEPMLWFRSDTDPRKNESNWWRPNRRCLRDMLQACGFKDVQTVYERDVDELLKRVCVHAIPGNPVEYERILPRKKSLMSVFGGERREPKLRPGDDSSVATSSEARLGV